MENHFTSLLIGVISGVLASYLFLIYYLGRKKPKIEISEHISKVNFKGEVNYFFKFVNKTDSEIFDVRVEATFFKPVGDLNGTNFVNQTIMNIVAYKLETETNAKTYEKRSHRWVIT